MTTYDINTKDGLNISKVNKDLFDFTGMKKVSLFNYCFTKTGGACDFECDKVPEEIKDIVEGTDGFKTFPKEHSKFCVRACPRFELFSIDKASEIIKLLEGN